MIKKLRVKFIAASMLALALVLLVILGGINVMSYRKTVSDADAILSVLASNQGMFPQRMSPAEDGASRKGAPGNSSMEDGVFRKRGFSDETPYESRFFSVLLDEAGRVLGTDTGKIAAVDQTAAAEYAQEVWCSGQNRGFWEEYRFIRSTEAGGIRIIFLDCGRSITGILSLMASLGMWTAPVMPVAPPIVSSDGCVSFVNAPCSGIFIPAVAHASHVEQGQELGAVVDPLTGETCETLKSPASGLLFTLREYPVVYEGSLIARILGGGV